MDQIMRHATANKDCVVPIINPNCLRIPVVNTSKGFVPRLEAIKNVAPTENKIHPKKYKIYFEFFIFLVYFMYIFILWNIIPVSDNTSNNKHICNQITYKN